MKMNLANNQLKELQDAFRLFDADDSGEISAEELKEVLKALDLKCVDEEVEKLMKAMDRNGDGSIQFYEFAKVMGSTFYNKKTKNELIAQFQLYDKDNNGSISADEIYEVMRDFRGNISKAEVKQLIALVDKDGNGTINIAEFIALMSI